MPEANKSGETALNPIITELDPSLYAPSREEIDFLKSQTKIEDEEELKQHVLAIQKEGWTVGPNGIQVLQEADSNMMMLDRQVPVHSSFRVYNVGTSVLEKVYSFSTDRDPCTGSRSRAFHRIRIFSSSEERGRGLFS